ncbi:hypothetical protein BKA70DRAFT_1312162 [Coprinopsis sp. MPI-PUGE-AT-0042]|nr:hypothetical protein BKA70DRAFT_1312162 [Coprinopsis sp. MPI-PUGE-AT-0042]
MKLLFACFSILLKSTSRLGALKTVTVPFQVPRTNVTTPSLSCCKTLSPEGLLAEGLPRSANSPCTTGLTKKAPTPTVTRPTMTPRKGRKRMSLSVLRFLVDLALNLYLRT